MRALDQIKSLGYDVIYDADKIKLSYKGEGKPDKSRVVPLLKEINANRNYAITELVGKKCRCGCGAIYYPIAGQQPKCFESGSRDLEREMS